MNTYVYTVYILCDSIYDMYVNLEIYIYTCSVFGIIYIYTPPKTIMEAKREVGNMFVGLKVCGFSCVHMLIYSCAHMMQHFIVQVVQSVKRQRISRP